MLQFLQESLNILFRRMQPDRIIENWLVPHLGQDVLKADWPSFSHALLAEYPAYSVDEARNIFDALKEITSSESARGGLFYLLYYAVKDILRMDSYNNCICRSEYLLQYRGLAHPLGSSLLIAAFCAFTDLCKTSDFRRDFSMNPVLRTDNHRLLIILSRGMAENHFHLGGSSNPFLFSWIDLMNRVTNRNHDFSKLNADKTPLDNSGGFLGERTSNLQMLVYKAAYIRMFLFELMSKSQAKSVSEVRDDLRAMDYSEQPLFTTKLQMQINALKMTYAAKNALDYANVMPYEDGWESVLERTIDRTVDRRSIWQFAGEANFLYNLFLKIYRNDPTMAPYAGLAYAYIVIWTRLRSELVQTNGRNGFENFSLYQDRKEIFTEKNTVLSMEKIRVAFRNSLADDRIRALEARFIPPPTAEKIAERVNQFDHLALQTRPLRKEDVTHKLSEKPKSVDQRLHYVLHFNKSRDAEGAKACLLTRPRDHMMREKMKNWSSQIIRLRKRYPLQARRITGIDACSNEIGCRPEVFSVSMRQMREYTACRDRMDQDPGKHLPRLRITYHVGEDFLDVSDGLRAIDECMTFLELGQGDRLGHAMVLGIDVERWYHAKGNHVILPVQDALDNIAWLYGKLLEYGLPTHIVEGELQDRFSRHFLHVYRRCLPFQERDHAIDLYVYWQSMKLRGDEPILYRNSPDHEHFYLGLKNANPHELASASNLFALRKDNWQARYLYHHYHFNPDLKKEGKLIVEEVVSPRLRQAIHDVQSRQRTEIAQKNIGIECNPSSNFLIGNFKQFEQHPILAFNDSELYDRPDNPRLLVSINTDDQGVFDTCLENEYALLACSLEAANCLRAPESQIQFSRIYEWLDNIRKMGLEQSFIEPMALLGDKWE